MSGIWKVRPTVEGLNTSRAHTLLASLGIQITEVGEDCLRGTMPCDSRTFQPEGIVHGGASVALAESLASIAATFCVDRERYMCVGQEVNANHLLPMRHGLATGTARPFHLGARRQVWGIEIVDESGRLACISRITIAVVERRRVAQDHPSGLR